MSFCCDGVQLVHSNEHKAPKFCSTVSTKHTESAAPPVRSSVQTLHRLAARQWEPREEEEFETKEFD